MRVAEDVGLDRCWFADNPYERSGLMSAAAVSGQTSKLGLGVGTVSARARNPVILAQDINAVASYCSGRFAVGLGLGHESDREALGLPKRSGLEILERTTGVLRQLLAGEAVTLGSEQSAGGARLRTETYPIPILFGAVGPRTLALAARLADGVILSLGASSAYLQEAVSTVAAARGASGRPRFEIVAYVFYGGAGDQFTANRFIRPMLAKYARAALTDPHIALLFKDSELSNKLVDESDRRMTEGGTFEDAMSDTMIDDFSIWGTPSQCIGTLDSYSSIGVTEVALGVGSWLPDPVQAIHEIGNLVRAWRVHNELLGDHTAPQ